MSVKMFYAWAVQERYIKRSPCVNIHGPKQDARVIVPLSEDQVDALLRLCPPNTWWGARDRAIISVLLTTGIRREELVGLDLLDLDFEANVLKVSGKGDQTYRCKERTLALLPQVVAPLLNWLRYRDRICRGASADLPALFLQYRSHQWERMTGNAVQRMMRRLSESARIEGVRVSAHTLRHTFSISCARNRIMKRSLQDLLGHRDPRSTEIYTRFVDHEMVLQEIRENNPFKGWKRL